MIRVDFEKNGDSIYIDGNVHFDPGSGTLTLAKTQHNRNIANNLRDKRIRKIVADHGCVNDVERDLRLDTPVLITAITFFA